MGKNETDMGMTMKEDETRRKIIEGAKKLFQLYGFTRITIDEIAVNLKMSKKTMYKHFKSKDDLIWGVVLSIQQPFVGRIQAAIQSDKDFNEILLEIFSLFQQLSLQITREVRQIEIDLAVARENVEVSQETLDLANETLERVTAQYRAGDATVLDVTEAELGRTRANLAWVTSRVNLLRAQARLRAACGLSVFE